MARDVTVSVVARDPSGSISAPKSARVVINEPPIIDEVEITPAVVSLGGQAIIRVLAHDPEGDPLTYDVQVSEGTVTPGDKPNEFIYTAPNA